MQIAFWVHNATASHGKTNLLFHHAMMKFAKPLQKRESTTRKLMSSQDCRSKKKKAVL